MQQLPLAIALRDDATFDSFHVTEANRLTVQALQSLAPAASYQLVFVCGSSGSGRTHLLQALCHRFEAAIYLPMGELVDYEPGEVFAALEHQPLVCLDDLGAIAVQGRWEEALFNFLNRKMLLGGTVVLAAGQQPEQLFMLPDLVSRLQQGLVLRLRLPDDDERAGIFRLRGRQRGMRIPEEVTDFVMRHYGRDLHGLMALLDDLDRHSLEQQRRITVPFVRELIDTRHDQQVKLL